MNETKTTIVTVTNKDFGYSVKFLKKYGYTFDAATKSWSGTRDISFLTDDGYAVEVEQDS
ncbi:MAG TPA: hypothetical protein VMX74_09545 [Pirellulales bacterium]|nr:hypothetical protein [Pirellulales bacterium]